MDDKDMGFTIIRPKIKKTIKKSGKDKYEAESPIQKFDELALGHFDPPLETAVIRQKLYQEYWTQFQSKINEMEKSSMRKVKQRVVEFLTENQAQASSASGVSENKFEIPLGFLVTDGDTTVLEGILEKVETELNISLARISSNKSPNVKSGFQNIAKQLLLSNPNASRFLGATRVEENSEEDDDLDESIHLTKNRYLSIFDLNTWYIKNEPNESIVLIVLDDVDMFPENVVKELLLLLSRLKFQFTLLLGLTSEFSPLTKYLPRDLVEYFKIEKFSPTNHKVQFETFIDHALYSFDYPFRLSGSVVNILRTYFNNYHFSISRLLQAFQMCLIEHFRKPESVFCCPDLESLWDYPLLEDIEEEIAVSTLKGMPDLDEFRKKLNKKVTTVRKSLKKKIKIAEELDLTKEQIKKYLIKCNNDILEWHEHLIVLYELGKGLPESPIGKSKLDLYILAMNGSLHKIDDTNDVELSAFDKLVKFVQSFSVMEMEKRFETIVSEIADFYEKNIIGTSKLVTAKMDRDNPNSPAKILEQIITAKDKDRIAQETAAILEKDPVVVPDSPRRRSTRVIAPKKNMTLAEWRRDSDLMQKYHDRKLQSAPEFAAVKKEIYKYLTQHIKPSLVNFSEIPFSSVFVFDDPGFIRRQLFPEISKEIHIALSQAPTYLNCECCNGETLLANHEDLPDTSIVYKLYLERTYHVIDLNDLYQNFRSYLIPIEPKRRGPVSKKAVQDNTNSLLRFRHAIAELQFLGLLKRNKRKPDEATRLTWIFT